jgi:Flp pilus assembly protein TadG
MRAMRHALRGFFGDKAGAALVEFTLAAPLLILLMCGLAEFANAMRQYHIMEKGVRDAGRYVARVQMTGCALDGAATTAAQNLALTGQISGGDFLLPTWDDPSTVTVAVVQCVNNSSRVYRGRDVIPVIEVTARAPYTDLGLLTVIGLGAITLEASHQQLWIGE